MNILITGGTGFIGSHLIKKIISLNHKVILLKRSGFNLWRINEFLPKLISYDVDKKDEIENIFKKNDIDCIFHLATCYVKNHKTTKEIQDMIKTNITFPSLLLESAIKNNVKNFINTGTCFEYKLSKRKLSEKSIIEPYNLYASTKIAFESILKYYTDSHKINAITLKLFYPYGEKDNKKIIPLIIKSFIYDKALLITKGKQQLNFTYVEDIAEAYIKGLTFLKSNKYNRYEAFNIGADKTYSIKQIVKILEKITNKRNIINLGTIPYSPNEIMYMNCWPKKAKEILNWQSDISVEEGLLRTYNYYLANKDKL